ncbi:MAG TPA: Ldh family oxidoreductase [Spirochaetia bacterium]|nr:Ldh family oxidoreductase [Spirochaetia bacterium]
MVVKSAEEWRRISNSILQAAGAPGDLAAIVTDHLVDASLMGHDSHGLVRLILYTERIRNGMIVAGARPEIIRDTPVSAQVDAHWGFGQVAGHFGTELVVEKAMRNGLALVGVVGCNHLGCMGVYPALAAEKGVVLLALTGGLSKVMVPYGGKEGRLDTNPIAVGSPAAGHDPLLVDMATSEIATGKLHLAKKTGRMLPPGCLVDREGKPSVDPDDYYDGGALLPFGGHKGYALAVAVAVLAGPLLNAEGFAAPDGRHWGLFLLGIDSGLFRPSGEYRKAVDELFSRIKSSAPAEGFKEVLVPGEPAARTRETRLRKGIPMAEEIWEAVRKTAEGAGVSLK